MNLKALKNTTTETERERERERETVIWQQGESTLFAVGGKEVGGELGEKGRRMLVESRNEKEKKGRKIYISERENLTDLFFYFVLR
ncbi:hypothetical protein LguiA_003279 [Lonicera macranthoides]